MELICRSKALDPGAKRWLNGVVGDVQHMVLCAAGFNIRWLMRALLRQLGAGEFKQFSWR